MAHLGIEGRLITPRSQEGDIVCSVVCLTYNQEAYVAKALDSFVMQETSFPIEVVVHDDASVDGTVAIVRRYEALYPRLIVGIYEKENQYAKRGHSICNDVVRSARGKYIALCEGDDYWTDARKLEKQVAFMEAAPECSMSFHAARIDYADGRKRSRVHRYPGRRVFSPSEVILGGGGFYMTCTAVFRRDVFDDYPGFLGGSPVGDIMLALNSIGKGTVGYVDEVMAVYNCGTPGSFTQKASQRTPCESLEFYRQLAHAQAEFDKYTNFRFSRWITRHRSKNAAYTLAGGAGERGFYEQYRRMRNSILPRHRVLFHLGYIYLWLKGFVQGPSKGRAKPGGCA
jgi:glycosyltransferase involved in cell wall biosynthesis